MERPPRALASMFDERLAAATADDGMTERAVERAVGSSERVMSDGSLPDWGVVENCLS